VGVQPFVRKVTGFARGAADYLSDLKDGLYGVMLNRMVDRYPADPRIKYPCYKSLDEYLDLNRLLALDGRMATEIREFHRRRPDAPKFFAGPMRLKFWQRQRRSSGYIELTKHCGKWRYEDIDAPEYWKPTEEAERFGFLMNFIQSLPFRKTARIMIIYDFDGEGVTVHRDHCSHDLCHHFIWFRTSLNKKLFMLDKKGGNKQYVTSYSAWFDTVNQFHGAEEGRRELNFSVRVDGIFAENFLKKIPVPQTNVASTAALWASVG
jgi:hypothetical protein